MTNGGEDSASYDVFLSYAREDQGAVQAIVAAMDMLKLRVWLDTNKIEPTAPIATDIAAAIAQSKVLVAYYSLSYPKKRYCQWELTAAWLAAEQLGAGTKRVLVVNPETNLAHILPTELHDHATLPTDPKALAEKVKELVKPITSPLGDIHLQPVPRWYGTNPVPPAQFVGRLSEMWQLHYYLYQGTVTAISAQARSAGSALAKVRGMGGMGKSLLAQEYALRFGAGYPGGVVWLRASAGGAGQLLPAKELEALRLEQMRELAINLGLEVEGRNNVEITARITDLLRKAQKPFLWVLDDWPVGADAQTLQRWSAPVPGLGRTLVTTRSRTLGRIGNTLELQTLAPEDALALLSRGATLEVGSQDEAAAKKIVERLGRHALAVDVAGAGVAALGLAGFLKKLTEPGKALKLSAELVGELPNGHDADVIRTLSLSVDQLKDGGRDALLLAAELPPEPVPLTLLAAVLAEADQLDPDQATERAALGINEAQKVSLAEDAGNQSYTQHILVTATLCADPALKGRRAALSTAAVAALETLLWPAVEDNRQHPPLLPLIAHARALTREATDQPTLDLLASLQWYDYQRGAYAAVVAVGRRLLAGREALSGAEHPATLTAMNELALSLWALGEHAEARSLQERVLDIRQRVLGAEHPHTLVAMNNLALTLGALGELAAARDLHRQVLDIRQRVSGAEHPDTLSSMNNLATTLHDLGDFAAARALWESALAISQRVLGADHPDTLRARHNLAATLWRQGEAAAARALLEAALPDQRRVLGDDHPDTASTFGGLAMVLAGMGEEAARRALIAAAPELAQKAGVS